MMDTVRKLIHQRILERKLTLKELSLAMGQNQSYLQQYLNRGVPRKLKEEPRARLCELLGFDEAALGGPVHKTFIPKAGNMAGMIPIPQHDVRASAGSGSIVESETEILKWPFPRNCVRHSLSVRSSQLALIEVIGDSMEPTLCSGDVLMIDLGDRDYTVPGIFAVYDGTGTVVKRLEKIPASRPPRVKLISDNARHSAYEVLAETVNVSGRAVWFGRRM